MNAKAGGKIDAVSVCLGGVIVVATLAMALRNASLYPQVFSDEYTYSLLARLTPLKDAYIPDFLYLLMYRLTNTCGDGFLECARLLNLSFFVAATPFIYGSARRVLTRRMALWVCVLSTVAPIGTYVTFFMPEAMYYFAFWALTWCVLRLHRKSSTAQWSIAGGVFGIIALIKPHSLLLTPALAVYFTTLYIRSDHVTRRSMLRRVPLFFVIAAIFKFGGGFVAAGVSGMTFFGTLYSAIARDTTDASSRHLDLFWMAVLSLRNNLVAVTLLFAVPIASMCVALSKVHDTEEVWSERFRLALYAASALAILLPVTALVTASVTGIGPYETISRIHMRYYNFLFPLLLIIGASASQDVLVGKRWRTIVAVVVGLIALYGATKGLEIFSANYVDSPDVRGITAIPMLFRMLSVATLLLLIFWWLSPARATQWLLVAYLPVTFLVNDYFVNSDLRLRSIATAYDNAGIFAKHYLPSEDLDKLVVVGSAASEVIRSQFHLDDAATTNVVISPGQPVDMNGFPSGRRWALVVGDHAVDKSFFQLRLNGFLLARLSSSGEIDFSKESWPGMISSASGLASREAWGCWSIGKHIVLDFESPLPANASIRLTGRPFGPNAGREFTAHLGDEEQHFNLGYATTEVALNFANAHRASRLVIDVPEPVSPRSIGMNDVDDRPLGVGLIRLKIGTAN